MTVCEDIWDVGTDDPLYTIIPLDEMQKHNPDFIINVSASPFNFEHAQARIHTVRANVDRYQIPMFYVNHCGAQTELIFDGGSIVMSGKGTLVDELPYFEECIRHYELTDVVNATVNSEQPKNKMTLIHDAIVMGLKDYFRKLGFKNVPFKKENKRERKNHHLNCNDY